MMGHIYVIKYEGMERYKIGKTAGTYDSLRKRYRTQHPNADIVKFTPSNNIDKDEIQIHNLLSKYRVNNSEWFDTNIKNITTIFNRYFSQAKNGGLSINDIHKIDNEKNNTIYRETQHLNTQNNINLLSKKELLVMAQNHGHKSLSNKTKQQLIDLINTKNYRNSVGPRNSYNYNIPNTTNTTNYTRYNGGYVNNIIYIQKNLHSRSPKKSSPKTPKNTSAAKIPKKISTPKTPEKTASVDDYTKQQLLEFARIKGLVGVSNKKKAEIWELLRM